MKQFLVLGSSIFMFLLLSNSRGESRVNDKSKCMEGWTETAHNCFMLRNNHGKGYTYDEAEKICKDQDSLLAYPSEDLKYWREEVISIHPGFCFMVWAGAHKKAEKGWVWNDDAPVHKAAWAAGEPGATYNMTRNGTAIKEVNSTGDCGALYSSGQIYDWGCDFRRAALCQIPKSSCDQKVCGKGAVCVALRVQDNKGRSGAIEDSACQCPVGYTGNPEVGGECVGLNTCDKVTCGAFTAECIDMNDGSYICKCLPGYTWESNTKCKFTSNAGDIFAYVLMSGGMVCVLYMGIKMLYLEYRNA